MEMNAESTPVQKHHALRHSVGQGRRPRAWVAQTTIGRQR